MQRKLLYTAVLMLNTIAFSAIARPTKHTSTLPVKIGYMDLYTIIDQLPEAKKISSELASFKKQLGAQLRVKNEELDQKIQAFHKEAEAMTEVMQKQKTAELEQLLRKCEQMKLEMEQKVAKKYRDLYLPVYEKVKSAIAQIAQEHHYTHILNSPGIKSGVDIVLYADEMYDVSKLVLKKLGIDPDKVTK